MFRQHPFIINKASSGQLERRISTSLSSLVRDTIRTRWQNSYWRAVMQYPLYFTIVICTIDLLSLRISILFVERRVWCFKITGQFTKCIQVKQNIFLLVTDVYLPPWILSMISSASDYYFFLFRITFSSFPVFSRIILSLAPKIAKLLVFYVAADPW